MIDRLRDWLSEQPCLVRLAVLILLAALPFVCGLMPGNAVQGILFPSRFVASTTGPPSDWYTTHFTEPPQLYDGVRLTGPIAAELLTHIDAAQESIHIAGFEFDLTPLAEALIAAHERDVDVRWFTDDEHGLEADGEDGRGQFAMLRDAGIPVRDDGRSALMHNKFVVFDEEIVWTGSTNFTENGLYENDNNVIVLDAPPIASMYEREFGEMWRGRSGGASRSTLRRQSTKISGTPVIVLFGPEDDVVEHLLPLVRRAEESIYFLAFSFTHDELGEELARRASKGVEVRGVFETRNASSVYSEIHRLYCKGVGVRKDGNAGNMHHKVFIVDGKIVAAGSFNFSTSADTSNDENMVFLNNADVAEQYTAEFESVWAEGSEIDPGSEDCSDY